MPALRTGRGSEALKEKPMSGSDVNHSRCAVGSIQTLVTLKRNLSRGEDKDPGSGWLRDVP